MSLDNQGIADTIFGNGPPPKVVPSGSVIQDAIAGGKLEQPKAPEPPMEKPVNAQANTIFGEAMDGTVLNDYAPVIEPVFNAEAEKARSEGNFEQALEIDKAAQTMSSVFKEMSVGDNLAKDIMLETSDYLRNQRSEEAIIATQESTISTLREKYGNDLDKNLAGARRVIQEAGKQVPNLIQVLERTGLGNSLKVVQNAITIARNRGYVK